MIIKTAIIAVTIKGLINDELQQWVFAQREQVNNEGTVYIKEINA